MKKILLIFFVLIFSSIAFSEEITCSGSGNNYLGKFSLEEDSYCDISLAHQGFKNSKIRVKISDGDYRSSNSFSFDVDSYLIINDAVIHSDARGEYHLDCTGTFLGGDTLDLDNSDSFSYIAECGDYGKDLVVLDIGKPAKDLDSPDLDFAPYTQIKIELKEKIVGTFLKEELGDFYIDLIGTSIMTGFKKTINELNLGVSHSFSVTFPKEEGDLGVVPASIVRINLDSIDYKGKTAVFKLTNTEENESSLCTITSSFEKDEEAEFENCIVADIRITGRNPGGKGKEVGSDVLYYFNLELNPKEPEVSAGDCTEDWECTNWSTCINGTQIRACKDNNDCGTTKNKPAETRSCDGTVTPSDLTKSQQQLNDLIQKKYNEIMGVK